MLIILSTYSRLIKRINCASRLLFCIFIGILSLQARAVDDSRPLMTAQLLSENDIPAVNDLDVSEDTPPAGIPLPDFPFKMNISNGTVQLPFLDNYDEEVVLTFMASEWQADPVELRKIGVRTMNNHRFLPIAVLKKANITTCHNVLHPHYSLRAKTVTLYALIDGAKLDMGKMLVTTRGLGMRMFGVPLITSPLPFVLNLSGIKSAMPIPSINLGSNSTDGQYIDTRISYRYSTTTTFEMKSRFGTEHFWRGKFSVSQPFTLATGGLTGTVSLLGSHEEDVSVNWLKSNDGFDERYSDLSLRRLPALEASTEPIKLLPLYPASTFRFGAAAGQYHEEPTDVSEFRSEVWGIFNAPLGEIGPLRLTAEFGLRAAFAGDDLLRTYKSSISASSPAGKDYSFDISYLRSREGGSSPFLFDKLLINNEINTALEIPFGKSSLGMQINHRYDLDNKKTRAIMIMPTYHDDCFLYGAGYDPISGDIRLGLQFNGFGTFREDVPGVSF